MLVYAACKEKLAAVHPAPDCNAARALCFGEDNAGQPVSLAGAEGIEKLLSCGRLLFPVSPSAVAQEGPRQVLLAVVPMLKPRIDCQPAKQKRQQLVLVLPKRQRQREHST